MLHGAAAPAPTTTRALTIAAWVLAGVLAVALAAMAIGPHHVGDYLTETDFYGAYAQGARLIEHGRLDPSRYGVVGPGYEVALALAGFVVRDLFVAGELLSLIATVVTLLLWFHLLARRANARVAFAAAAFMACNAFFFRYGYAATTDALAIALEAGAIYLLLARSSSRAILGAGLLASAAFLTRYNAIALLPAGLVALLAGGGLVEQRGRGALLFAAGFVIPVVPWVLYSLAHSGAFSFQLHHNLAYEVFARSRGIPWDEYQRRLQPEFPTLWSVIARDPVAVTRHLFFNVFDHLRLDASGLLGWPTALVAAAGVALGARDGSLRRLWPVWLAWALLFVTLVPVFHSERYSLAMLPMYAALAGIAVGSPILALVLARRFWLKAALAGVPVLLALSASFQVQARTVSQLPVEVLQCADTLRANAAPGDKVIARKGHIGYHSGVEVIPFPFTRTIPELATYARDHHARWLYFSWPEAEMRQRYRFLLDTTAVVPGLKPRCVTRPHPAVLYEIGPDFGIEPAWMANDTLRAFHLTNGEVLLGANDPKVLYRQGGLAWTLGRYAEARTALEAAARVAPDDPKIFNLLGDVLMKLNEPQKAAAAFARARRLSRARGGP